MGQTNRKYPVWQILISTRSKSMLASRAERIQEGDIIALLPRSPGGMGLKEMNHALWLEIDGLEEGELALLTQINTEPLGENGDNENDNPQFDKRRFSIPLERLKVVVPWLDLIRVRDQNDSYQPFLPVDLDNDEIRLQGVFLPGTKRKPLQVQGLIFDKATGEFI